MKSMIKPCIVLLIITSIAAALLGIVQSVTAEPIAVSKANSQAVAMKVALPEAETFETIEGADFTGTTISSASIGKDASGTEVGYVITANPSGFGGAVPTTVGIGMDGVITGVDVTTPSETPGLGALAADSAFTSLFVGKSGSVAVTKDGGEIAAITSATITSRAVSGGVTETLEWFAANGGAN